MILMFSGEGKTDMGQMVPKDHGMKFKPGPMAWLVDRLVEKYLDDSQRRPHCARGTCNWQGLRWICPRRVRSHLAFDCWRGASAGRKLWRRFRTRVELATDRAKVAGLATDDSYGAGVGGRFGLGLCITLATAKQPDAEQRSTSND